ncbi:MAG: glycosyltransferase, partial [Erysipelotrichia bacterium]|nr:glycosyltransferase [Erysipelotrichia bacterium]
MRILLYFEGESLISTSGIGRAFEHQKAALESAGIDYTSDPWDEDYDILHINTYYMNSEAIIANARRMGRKVVYHAHSTEEDFRNSFVLSNVLAPVFKDVIVNLYSKADCLITPTPYSRKILLGYGIHLPIYPVSNGIELKQFSKDTEKVKAYRKYFSLNEDDKVIISVGLPFERKGILDFVEVARQLPQYKFIWFGEINPALVPREINEAVENHPYNVMFPGYVKGPIIQGAYQDASCFFFPSYEETEGIVVLEALASHQNVLVRDIGAFDPWLKDGVNCHKGKTNEEFIRLLQDIVEQKISSTKEAGFMVAEERSIDQIGQHLKHVYECTLNNSFD